VQVRFAEAAIPWMIVYMTPLPPAAGKSEGISDSFSFFWTILKKGHPLEMKRNQINKSVPFIYVPFI
jgi:hypothetical protein